MRAAPPIRLAGALIVAIAWGVSASACAPSRSAAQADPQDPALSGLAQALMSPDALVRQDAIMALLRLRTVPPAAWPSLRNVFEIEDMELRTRVAISLGKAGDSDDATVGALLEALELQPRMREEVMQSLEASGAVLASITRSQCYGSCPSYSVQVLKDGAVVYVGYSSVKVEGFGSKRLTPAQLETLVGAFQEADYFSLADSYRPLGSDAASVCLRFSRNDRTKRVAHDLSNPGPDALQRLEQRFDEIVGSQEWVGTNQEGAATAHQRSEDAEAGNVRLAALPAWVKRLADPRLRVRRLAAREIYPEAARAPEPQRSQWQRAASLVLAEALGDPDEGQRYQAISALQGNGVLAPEAVDALVKGLGDPSTRVRHGVYARLYWVGPAARSAMPVLLERLDSPEFIEWQFAARALGRIGAAAKPAVPALVRGLGKGDERARAAAAQALGWIGPAASTAVPALEAALSDPDPAVRKQAAAALRAIQP